MGKKVFAILVLTLFVAGSLAFAGGACNTCGKPMPCNTCGTPKASCGTATSTCDNLVQHYKRDILGNRVPVFTEANGTWHNDAAGTRAYIITGTEPGANT